MKIDSKRVSRVHARICYDGRQATVKDCSRYGTFLNGMRIDAKKPPVLLKSGDVISVWQSKTAGFTPALASFEITVKEQGKARELPTAAAAVLDDGAAASVDEVEVEVHNDICGAGGGSGTGMLAMVSSEGGSSFEGQDGASQPRGVAVKREQPDEPTEEPQATRLRSMRRTLVKGGDIEGGDVVGGGAGTQDELRWGEFRAMLPTLSVEGLRPIMGKLNRDSLVTLFERANVSRKKTLLQLFACEGSVDVVRYLVQTYRPLVESPDAFGEWVNKRNEGESALHLAAHNDHFEVADELLRNNADVHAKDTEGMTPLVRAIAKLGTVHLVSRLLEAGAKPDEADKKGNTSLHWALDKGETLMEGDDDKWATMKAHDGGDPLVWLLLKSDKFAKKKDVQDLAALLVQAGSDPDELSPLLISPWVEEEIQPDTRTARQLAEKCKIRLPPNKGLTRAVPSFASDHDDDMLRAVDTHDDADHNVFDSDELVADGGAHVDDGTIAQRLSRHPPPPPTSGVTPFAIVPASRRELSSLPLLGMIAAVDDLVSIIDGDRIPLHAKQWAAQVCAAQGVCYFMDGPLRTQFEELRARPGLPTSIERFMDALPPGAVLPELEVVAVDASDPRKELHGQSKLVLSAHSQRVLAKYEMLGIYTGRLYLSSEDPPPQPSLQAVLDSIGFVYQFQECSEEICGDAKLNVDAFDNYGNKLMAANDANTCGKVVSGHNARFVEFKYKGWPHVGIFAAQMINPGDEILVPYTEKYWSMYNLLDECFAEPVNVLRRNARCVRQKFDLALHELRDKLSEAEEKIQEQGREIQELRQQRHVPEAQQRA
ncbi:serine threonine-protein phosphatase 6 regulatory ankyrin repeat subunit b-like protein [Chrysochromulina tobinii]|uniref:Serine threonine-protein phosphatase 6 regulatory ankyrin repeat subunit b-like protein n=1 Tax=Chrysochromulina tobinii TaxID=1460289 RepID=A0A0M0JHA2_9EUKA|nr:serine threonine-protein phosphatase 6 regulatory ankyrin repeat subunit b-like protein [Chrysochromulina tobinii]|eukprot:KOO25860.1 serine threonine-protein phosphatase 6 regulatory ankyrin repeat subunit b-like protein [Chrysochromulina sp. CCMP291]